MKLRRLVFALCVVGTVSAAAAPSGPDVQGAVSPETRAVRASRTASSASAAKPLPCPVISISVRRSLG